MSTRRRTYVWLFGCSRTGFGGKPYFEKTHTNTADDLSLRIYTHTQYITVRWRRTYTDTDTHTRSSIRSQSLPPSSKSSKSRSRSAYPAGRGACVVPRWQTCFHLIRRRRHLGSSLIYMYISIILQQYITVCNIYLYINRVLYTYSAASPNYSDRQLLCRFVLLELSR